MECVYYYGDETVSSIAAELIKSRSRISLLPLLVAFAVTMIVGVGSAWGQALNTGTTNAMPFWSGSITFMRA